MAVVFLAGSVPRALPKQRVSSEKPGLTRSLTVKEMLPLRGLVSATEAPSPTGLQPVKRMLVVKQLVSGWENPIWKQSPQAKETLSAKASLLLSIRPKGRVKEHRRRQ